MVRIKGMLSWDRMQESANGWDPDTKVFLFLSNTGLNNPDNQIADHHYQNQLILDICWTASPPLGKSIYSSKPVIHNKQQTGESSKLLRITLTLAVNGLGALRSKNLTDWQ